MRWLLSLFIIALSALVQGLSCTGNRLLVVIEEAVEKVKYSQFWGDLEGPRIVKASNNCGNLYANSLFLKAEVTKSPFSLQNPRSLRYSATASEHTITSSSFLQNRKASYLLLFGKLSFC